MITFWYHKIVDIMSIEYNEKHIKKGTYLNNGSAFYRERKNSKIYSDNIQENSVYCKNVHDVNEEDKPHRHLSNLSTGPNEKHREVVVFERIVPSAVKKMWVKAEESGSGSSIVQNHLDKDKTSPIINKDKNLSFQCGDVLLSRDVVKEETTNKRIGKTKKSFSVSEESEISHAKGKWGIELKHIDDSDKLPFGFPKLKQVTSGHQRPKSSLIDDNFSVTSNLNSKHRSRSVDALDDIDGENSFSEDYPSELSVQQRSKKFFENNFSEKTVIKQPEFDKYAYLHAKRLNMKGVGNVDLRSGMNNSKIFYQPQQKGSMDADSSIDSNNFPAKDSNQNKPQTRSLHELLKHDQKCLEGRVIRADQSDNNNNKKNEKNIENKILKEEKKSGNHNQYKYFRTSVEKPIKDPENLLLQHKTQELHNNHTRPKIVKKLQTDEATTYTSQKKEYLLSVENTDLPIKIDTGDITEFHEENFSNELQDPSTCKINTGPDKDKKGDMENEVIVNTKLDIDKGGKEIHSYISQPNEEDLEKQKFKEKNTKQLQYNEINEKEQSQKQYQCQKPQKKEWDPKWEKQTQKKQQPTQKPIQSQQHQPTQIQPHKSIQPQQQESTQPQQQQLTQLQQPQQQQSIQVQQPQQLQSTQLQQSQLQKTTQQHQEKQKRDLKLPEHNEKKKPMEESKMKYNKLGQVVLTNETSNKESPNVDSDNASSVAKSKSLVTPNQSAISSPGEIRRRVGKLIIMTGEQRDKQLKEMETNKNSAPGAPRQIAIMKQFANGASNAGINGLSLIFISNEVVDDDPNEPPPPVPVIIFNSPVIGLRSIISKDRKNKQKKKNRVQFNENKLTNVHSYPLESSYLEETDNSGKYAYAASAVQNERERMLITYQETRIEERPQEIIKSVMEGEHFNSHFEQEGGAAMLF